LDTIRLDIDGVVYERTQVEAKDRLFARKDIWAEFYAVIVRLCRLRIEYYG